MSSKRLSIIIAIMLPLFSYATQVTWDGGGNDSLWTTANNWSNNSVPASTDTVTIDAGAYVLIDAYIQAGRVIIGGTAGNDTLAVSVGNTLDLVGDLVINSDGVYELANSATMTIEGNWSNAGVFNENASQVTFDNQSSVDATIINSSGSETFYALVINSTGGNNAVRNFIAGTDTTRIIVTSNLAVNDGEFTLRPAIEAGPDLDVQGDISLAQAGEGIDFRNAIIYIGGDFNINDTNNGAITSNSSSLLIYNGTGSQSHTGTRTTAETFGNVWVNKSSGTLTYDRPIIATGDYNVISGDVVFSSSDITVGAAAGDSLIIQSGTSLTMNGLSTINMVSGTNIDVQSGGTLSLLGTDKNNMATVTVNGASGSYDFDVSGTIRSKYTNYSYMTSAGINLKAGSTLHATDNFDFSRFSNVASGAYMTVADLSGTFQSFRIDSVTFADEISGGYNVYNQSSSDTLKFYGSDGNYAGEANDLEDSPNTILWYGTISTKTWNGNFSSTWTTGGNWSPTGAPTSNDVAIIPSGASNPPIISADTTLRDLTINSGAKLTLANNVTLTVKTDLTLNDSLYLYSGAGINIGGQLDNSSGSITSTGTSTITFNGTGSQSFVTGGNGAGKAVNNLTVAKSSGTLTINGNLDVNNNISMSSGSITTTVSTDTLFIANSWTNTGAIFSANSGVVVFDGTGTLNSGGTGDNFHFYDIIFTGTTHTLGSDIAVDNDYEIQTGATVDASGSNYDIYVGGDYTNDGTFTPQSGTVVINGTDTQVIDFTPSTFYNLTIDKTSGTVTHTAVLKQISNNFTINSGTFTTSGNNVDVGGGIIIGSAGTFSIGNDTIYVAGKWEDTGALVSGGSSKIIFDASSGSYSISEPTSNEIEELEFGGGATYTLVTTLDVDNGLTISGTATLVANDQDIYVGDFWRNNANFNSGSGGTVYLDDAGTDSIYTNGDAFYNLTVVNGTVYPAEAIDINGDFTVTGGNFRDSTNVTINVGKNFTIGAAGNVVPVLGTFIFDGQSGGPYSIDDGDGQNQLGNVILAAGAGVTYQLSNANDSETDIDGDFTISSGTLDLNGYTLNFGTAEAVDYDTLSIDGTLVVGPGSILKMDSPQALDSGNDIVVNSGGTLEVVGSSGNNAQITRIGEGASTRRKWRLSVKSGGTMKARYAVFKHIDGTNGMFLETGAILDPVSNFSDCQFDAGSTNGRYLQFGDLSGTANYTLNNVGFLNQLTGTSYNVKKANAATDTIFFQDSYGVFAGEDYDEDAADNLPADSGQIIWRGTVPSRQWTGSTNTSWDEPTNWVGNAVPSATEDVLIPNVTNDPVVSANDTVNSVSFNNGGNITIQGGAELHVLGDLRFGSSGITGNVTVNSNGKLYATGDWDKQYGNFYAGANSEVIFDGGNDQYVHTGGTNDNDDFDDLTINKTGGTISVANTIQVDSNFTFTGGSLDMSYGLGYGMQVGANYTNTGGTLIPGNQTVTFNGTGGYINGGTGAGKEFYRVRILAGTYILSGDMDVSYELQIDAGTTLDAGSNYTLYLGRLLDNDGSFVARNGTLVLDGSTSVTLDVVATLASFYNLTIDKTGGGVIDVNGYVDVQGDFTVTQGQFDFDGTDTLDVGGNVTIAVDGALSRTGNVGILVAGDWTNSGTFSDNTGITIFDGSNQTLTGSFYSMELSGSGTKTAGEALDINRDITIGSGVTFNGSGYNHTIGRNWVNADGSYTPGTGGTITFDGTVDDTLFTGGTAAGKTFENLVINNSGNGANDDVTIVGDLKITGDFTLTDGQLHTEVNNNNIDVAGNWTVSSSSSGFLPGTGTVTFNGSSGGPYNIDHNGSAFNLFTMDASGVTYQLSNDLNVDDDLTIANGTLDLNGKTLQFGDQNTDSIKISGGTLEIDGNGVLQMYAGDATGSGSDVVVQNGGTISVVGVSGSDASVTRFTGTGASDLYSFTVDSGATIQARYASFEYMDANGINLANGSTLHPINNFSDVSFNNGPSGGRYLKIGDLSGSLQKFTISGTSFLSNPGGGAYNVDKSNSTDSLNFDMATGVFSGASYELDPGNVVSWTNATTTRNWTGSSSQNWNDPFSWEGNQIPSSSEDVNIPSSASQFPIVSGRRVAHSVSIEGGASLTISDNDTLDISGNLIINSTATLTMSSPSVLMIEGNYTNAGTIVESTSKIIFDGSGDQSINAGGVGGTQELYDVVIDKSGGTATLASTIEMNGSFEIANGSFDVSGSNFQMQIDGSWTNNGTFTPQQGTVLFKSSGGTIDAGGSGAGKKFYTLSLNNSASKTLASNIAVTNNLNILGGTTLDVSASNYSINVGGTWNNDGIFTARSGTVTLDGTSSQAMDVVGTGASSFYNLEINKSAGTATLSNSPLDINGSFTLTSGTLDFGAYTVDIEGNTTITGTLTGTGTITAAANWTNTSGLLSGANTLTLDGTNQSFSGDFHDLTLGGTGTKTAGDVIDLAGNFTINSGVTFDAGSYTHTIAGNWDNGGIFTASTSTITFDSTNSQTITTHGTGSTKAFYDLVINKPSGTISLQVSNDMQVDRNVTISSGTVAFDGNTLYVGGNWSNSGTVQWTTGSGTVVFNGSTGIHTIADGSSDFALVEIDASAGTYQLSEKVGVNGRLQITSGTLSLNGNILEFGNEAADSILVQGTLSLDGGSSLQMYTASDTGSALIVQAGGKVSLIGTSGNNATVTRFNGSGAHDQYTFAVDSAGTIEAQYVSFEYMNNKGVELRDNAILSNTYNFSNTEFNHGEAALSDTTSYITIGDLSGTTQIFNLSTVGFLSDLGANGVNIYKTASSDTLKIDASYGAFAGKSYERDPIGNADYGLLQWTNTSAAISWTGTTSSAWDVATNWNSGTVPTASEDVIIPDVSTDPVVKGLQVVKSVTVQSGGFLTIYNSDTLDMSGNLTIEGILQQQNSSVLQIAGNYINSGTLSPNQSKIEFDGTGDQSLNSGGTTSSKTFYNVDINKSSGTLTLKANLKIDNNLDITQGTFDVSSSNYDITLANNWTNSGTFVPRSGTVYVNGSSTFTTGGNGSGKKFYNLTTLGATSATATLAGNIDIDNTLNIETASTFDVSASNYQVNIGGNWNNDGTFTAHSGTVIIDGSGAQDIDAAATVSTFYNFTINKSAGTATLSAGPLDVNGAFTLTSGTFDAQNVNMDIEGNVSVAGTLSSSSNTIYAAADWSVSGTFTSSGLVTLDGTTQSFAGTFNNLSLSGSATKTVTAAIDLSGNLTVNSGVTFSMQSYTHTFAGNWNNAGTIISSSSTAKFDGSGNTQTIVSGGSGTSFGLNDFVINKSSGTVQLSTNPLSVLGSLTISSGTLDLNGQNMYVAGHFSNSAGFSAGSGYLIFNGTTGGPYDISTGSATFANIDFNAPGVTYQLTSDIDVDGDLAVYQGTFDLNGRTMNFGNAAGDSIKVFSTFNVDAGAYLKLYVAAGAGSKLAVENGGTISVLGSSGNRANVTRFNGSGSTDRYGFAVLSGGTLKAKYGLFEYMDANGVELRDGSDLDSTYNLSNTNFNNGASGGAYLSIGNLTGTNHFSITSTGFLSNPGGGAFNVSRTTAASADTLDFDQASGTFAGSSYENEQGVENTITWTNVVAAIQWAGGGSNWNTGGNWVGGSAPTSSDDALIPSGATPYPQVTGTQVAGSVTIESSASLTIATGDTLDLAGSMTINGTLTINGSGMLMLEGDYTNAGLFNANSSTIVLDGTADQTVDPGGTDVGKPLYKLTINKSSGSAILASALSIQNDLDIQAGKLDVSASNYAITASGNWTNSGTFTPRNGTVTFDNATTLTTGGNGAGKAFYNIAITTNGSGAVTLAGNLDIDGNLSIASGTSLDVTANDYSLNVGGNWANDGTFSSDNCTVTFDGTGDQSIDANGLVDAFWNFTVNKASGTATLTTGPLDVNGDFSVTSGTLATGTINLDIEGTTTISGTLSTGINSINAAGNWSASGSVSGSSTVTLDGTGQNISGSFNNLILGGSGTKTATSTLDVNGDLTINSSVTLNAGSYTHTVAGDWDNSSGTFTASTSTITFDGTSTQTLTSGGTGVGYEFNKLTVNKSAGSLQLAASNDLDVNSDFTISAGIFNASTSNVSVGGDFANSGTYTPGTGVLTFNGASANFTIDPGGSSFAAVTLNGANANFQLTSTTDINGNLTITAGALDLNGQSLTFGDAVTDTIDVSDSLYVDANATLSLFTGSNSGAGITVNSGGTFRLVGSSGNVATLTRFSGSGASDRYRVKVLSGATIESRYATIEYVDTSGVVINDGATIHATNNFSNTEFDNGAPGGRLLAIGDITGAGQKIVITSTGFLSNPGSGAVNVEKTATSTDTLNFDQAYGVFAGESFDKEPGAENTLVWTNAVVAQVWNGGGTTDWTLGSNWSGASAPAANEDAIIPASASPYPTITGTIAARSVTIRSGATLTISAADTLDLSGSLSNSGSLTMNNGAVLSLEGDYTNSNILTANTSKIKFDGTANQTLNSGGTASDKRFSKIEVVKASGSLVLGADIDVNDSLDVIAGTLDVSSSNYNITLAGNFDNAGTFTAQSGTFTLDGTSAQNVNVTGSGAFYNLTIGSTNTVSLVTAIDVDNAFVINSGATFNASTFTSFFGGNWTNNGTFTASTSTIRMNGAGSAKVIASGGSSFNNVTFSAGSGASYTLSGDLDINGDLYIYNGNTLDIAGNNLTFGDAAGDSIDVYGVLQIGANGSAQMANGTIILVPSSGKLTVTGSGTSATAQLTQLAAVPGNYKIIIQSGGEINAKYALFEYLGGASAIGIDIQSGATINATNKLDYSTFQNGTGTAYLQIGNSPTLTVSNATFVSGPTYNVQYTTSSGSLTFADYDGNLSGSNKENDTNSKVDWIFTLTKDVSTTSTVTYGNDIDLTPSAAGQFGSITIQNVNQVLSSAPNSMSKYFVVSPDGIGTGTADMNIYYADSELNGQAEGDLKLWHISGGDWNGPITPDAQNTTANSITFNSFTIYRGISDTLILSNADNDQSLPVELIAFTAQPLTDGINIAWTTASEIENAYWTIERAVAPDSLKFVEIEQIQGMGTVSTFTNYQYLDESVEAGKKYYYKLNSVSYDGYQHDEGKIGVRSLVPHDFSLSQNYPNPFNGGTSIQFAVPHTQIVEIIIYNTLGQKIRTLTKKEFQPGFYKLTWNGQNENSVSVASGMYLYSMRAENFKKVLKMIYLK